MNREIDVWDKIAEYYKDKRYYGKKLFSKEKKVLLSLIPKASLVLDVGCGTGRHVRFLKSEGRKVVGIDKSKKMIFSAKEISNDTFIVADAHHIPFKDKVFDFVVCLGNTIGSLCPALAIKEMMRVARKGVIIEFRYGKCVEKRKIGKYSYYVKCWSIEEVESFLEQFTFREVKIIKGERLKTTFFFYAWILI